MNKPAVNDDIKNVNCHGNLFLAPFLYAFDSRFPVFISFSFKINDAKMLIITSDLK